MFNDEIQVVFFLNFEEKFAVQIINEPHRKEFYYDNRK